MSDGLVELAEFRERVGEIDPRIHRPNLHRLLVSQIAFERGVVLEEDGRLTKLSPREVRPSNKGSCDCLDRAISEGPRDGEGLSSKSEGPVVVASGQALDHHKGGDSREPVLIAERPGEHLRLMEVISHAPIFAKLDERVPQINVDVDALLRRLPRLRQIAKGAARLFQVSN